MPLRFRNLQFLSVGVREEDLPLTGDACYGMWYKWSRVLGISLRTSERFDPQDERRIFATQALVFSETSLAASGSESFPAKFSVIRSATLRAWWRQNQRSSLPTSNGLDRILFKDQIWFAAPSGHSWLAQ
jgi:hypothetical protein